MADDLDALVARLNDAAYRFGDSYPVDAARQREAAAALERLRAENARLQDCESEVVTMLRSMLPDIPLRERECKTLGDWRHRALYLESQWSRCSGDCARIQDRAERAEARVAELERVPEDAALDEVASKLAELATICRADGQRNAVDACVVARIMFRRLRVHLADALRENAALHDVHDDNLVLKAELRQERLIRDARAQDVAGIVAERDGLLRKVGTLRSELLGIRMEFGEGPLFSRLSAALGAEDAIDAARGKP